MLLCLDASTEKTMIGLLSSLSRGEERLGTRLLSSPTRSEERIITDRDRLPDHVRALLSEQKIEPRALDGIAIGSGPGSFTGLRVSYAFAKGLARGAELNILPVSSLQVLAANYAGSKPLVAVISSARKNAVHWSVFDRLSLRKIGAHEVVAHEELRGKLTEEMALIGPGLAKLNTDVRDALRTFIPASPAADWPRVEHLGRLALAEWRGKTPPDISGLVPEYGLDFPM